MPEFADIPRPDGIEESSIAPASGRLRSALPVLILGVVMALGLSGLFGGPARDHSASAAAARITVLAPDSIRGGEIFETTVSIDAVRRISKLVVGVSPALWRDLTINSIVPGATEEGFKDGLILLTFGAMAPGDHFRLKVAAQGNPSLWGVNAGKVVVFDGETSLVELPIGLRVHP